MQISERLEQPLHFVVGGIFHETNTYALEVDGATRLDAFEVLTGAEIERAMMGTEHIIGGYIDRCRHHGARLSYSTFAAATPSATIGIEAYTRLKQDLIDGIRQAMPVDGVLMAPHGAGVVEGIDDLEGDLLAAVRQLVGPDVPIASVYDLHGQMTEQMRATGDLTLPCRLYPHTDLYERALQIVDLLVATARRQIRPVTAMAQAPMLAFLKETAPGSVVTRINDLCLELSRRPGVLDCSWFHGFPYADIPAPSPVAVCTTDGDEELARQCADQVAAFIWACREEFPRRIISPEDGVRLALDGPPGLVVINENSDNPGGGAPGDSTHLLRALINAGLPHGTTCFVAISDAETVQRAVQAGVGTTIQVALGGKRGPRQGEPLQAAAYVKALTDGRFANLPGSVMAGVRFDLGPSCRLIIDGVDVVVTSKPEQTWDPAVAQLHGLDVSRYRIVALKGANHFRAGFASLTQSIVSVDSEGLSSADVLSFPKTKLPAPLWPLVH